MKKKLTVNNNTVEFEADEQTPLLWILREQLGITGTKYGCGVAACGACTVLVDGKALRSCSVPLQAFNESQQITTIESQSLKTQNTLKKVWAEMSVSQCGYCQSGMIMSATALLEQNLAPTDIDIDNAIGNICRCGTYQLVRSAIKQASKELQNG